MRGALIRHALVAFRAGEIVSIISTHLHCACARTPGRSQRRALG
ncbi:MAG: hypothetical protein M0Z68_03760 [Gammaproteobacteria bacterium]|nr:hypothetical protein [Gammaproteobacteria bacterium]